MMADLRVFILDDERLEAEMIANVIMDLGYSCSYKNDSQSALVYCRENTPNIIFLDIMLNEEVTGVDLISKFKEVCPEAMVIMLTGEYNNKHIISALRAGANDYILKPVDVDLLNERLMLAEQTIMSEALSKIYFNTIVHDLKTPISVMILLHDLLERMPYYSDDVNFRKIVHSGKQAVSNIYKMVGNILSIEKFSKGKFKTNKHLFKLKDCITESLDIFNPVIPDAVKPINFIYDLDDGVEVNNDPELFSHILYNLVANGLKYSTMDVPVDVIVESVDEGKYLKVSVRNMGSYIEEKYRDKIFDKFFQIKNKGELNLQNFGLGLTFCKTAIAYMNGTIWVESDKQLQSTTFIYKIPVK